MGLFWDPMLGRSHVYKKATFYSDTSKCLVLALPKCKNLAYLFFSSINVFKFPQCEMLLQRSSLNPGKSEGKGIKCRVLIPLLRLYFNRRVMALPQEL